MSHLNPDNGLLSQHTPCTIGNQMQGTIYPHNSPYALPPSSPAAPPTLSPDRSPAPTPPTFSNLTSEMSDADELLGTTTDSGITPAMYNLWQSFASLFLPQSLALPPHLSPISLLSYSYISQQLRPFDLILIRTPGLAYNTMRSIIEHSYDHVAIVLTHNCALHISPPYTRIIPIASLIAPNRNPIILRPKFAPQLSPPLAVSTSTALPSPPLTARSLTSPTPASTPPSHPPTPSPTSTPTPLALLTTPTFSPDPNHVQSLFLQLLKLLGTPYDSLKMYTLWGKLALNRMINQPITKIDSTGVICTDAIMNILCQYDQLFTLSNIIKQWIVLHNHTRLPFNTRSAQAIQSSKTLNFPLKGIQFTPHNVNHGDGNQPLFGPSLDYHASSITTSTTATYTFNRTATLLPIPQSTIHHQLPLSNLEMLSFTRLSAWSLNDLLQLSHPHVIYPNPQIHPVPPHALPITPPNPANPTTFQSPTDLPSIPTHSPTKQFDHIAKTPLFVDAAFEVLSPPCHPIPITYLFPFCHQLSLMCANFVLRETTSFSSTTQPADSSPTPQSSPSPLLAPQSSPSLSPTTLPSTIASTSPPPLTLTPDAPQSQQPIKHDRHQLLKLVNPYHRSAGSTQQQQRQQQSPQQGPNNPQQQQQNETDAETDATYTLADSLYYYLICRLPGMIPLYLLQSMKLSLDSLQRGKKYEIKPQVLLFDHPISHPALLKLSREVNTMFQDLVLQPFLLSMKQAEEHRLAKHLQQSHHFLQSQSLHHMVSNHLPTSSSSTLPGPSDQPKNNTSSEGLTKLTQSQLPPSQPSPPPLPIPTSLLSKSSAQSATASSSSTSTSPNSFIAGRLRALFSQLTTFSQSIFSPTNITPTNPDGLDPTIQSTLVHSTNLSQDPTQEIKVDSATGHIVAFPQWLKALLPADLFNKMTDLVNIAVSPGEAYKERLKGQNMTRRGHKPTTVTPLDVAQVFMNPRLDPNHPFPSIKYLSSVPAPFLLYIWSLLKPILRFYLILTLLSRFLPYLVYKLTASTITALLAVPTNTISWAVNSSQQQQQQPRGLLKRLFTRSPAAPPRPRLMATFRSRFLAFVYAVVTAAIVRAVWNSSYVQTQLQTTTQSATQTLFSRITAKLNPSSTSNDGSRDDDADDIPIMDPAELTQQQNRLQQLLPSNLLKEAQQIASNSVSTSVPLSPTHGSSSLQQHQQQHHPHAATADSSLLISPTYTNRFLEAGSAPTTTVMSEITTLTRSLLDSYRSFLSPGATPPPPGGTTTPPQLPPPSPQVQTFLERSDQSLAWLNEVLKATFYITTDTLGLRTISKRVSNSRSMKEIQRQFNNVRGQLNRRADRGM